MAPADLGVQPKPEARTAVRGCPAGEPCFEIAGELRQFELAAFGTDPWLGTREPPRRPGVIKPSMLRADEAWLDTLRLPDLPVVWTERLITYLLFYKNDPRGRRIMEGWLRRAGRYEALVKDAFRARRLPEDLFYVSMIESSFDVRTVSYAGAAGLWQFMPDGGRAYGLRVDRWMDERLDPVRATQAAMDYFADLYARFGNWHLALAAYNAGYGAVIRSVVRYNSNDYWSLSAMENGLAWETSLYVPKALAVAIVAHNRAAFGFEHVVAEPPESVDMVRVPARVTLGTIARLTRSKADDIRRLNPQLRRGRTPPDGPYAVRVPRGLGQLVENSPELELESMSLDIYHVAYGERLEDLAKLFGTTQKRLRELNEVTHAGDVAGGTTILVPRIDRARLVENRKAVMDDLHASGIDQKPGEPLVAPVPDKDQVIENRRRVFYRVVAGDQLVKLAPVLGLLPDELAAQNGLSVGAALLPRMVLQAYVAPTFSAEAANIRLLDESRVLVVTRGSAEHLDLVEGRIGRKRSEYKPKRAESLEKIGKKFGLGPRDLARINRMPSDSVIGPGQTIIVYEVVDRKRSERAAEQWRKAPKAARGGSTKPDAPRTAAELRRDEKRAQDDVVDAAADMAAVAAATDDAEAADDAAQDDEEDISESNDASDASVPTSLKATNNNAAGDAAPDAGDAPPRNDSRPMTADELPVVVVQPPSVNARAKTPPPKVESKPDTKAKPKSKPAEKSEAATKAPVKSNPSATTGNKAPPEKERAPTKKSSPAAKSTSQAPATKSASRAPSSVPAAPAKKTAREQSKAAPTNATPSATRGR